MIRAVVHEVGPGRWRCGLAIPAGPCVSVDARGSIVEVLALVDEALDVARVEWPELTDRTVAALEWWAADILDDTFSVTPPAHNPTNELERTR